MASVRVFTGKLDDNVTVEQQILDMIMRDSKANVYSGVWDVETTESVVNKLNASNLFNVNFIATYESFHDNHFNRTLYRIIVTGR